MTEQDKKISSWRLRLLRVQGYCNYTDEDLSKLAFGNSFAYYLCGSIVLIGVVTANIPVLSAMMMVAIGGFALPRHPFDYIYNNFLSSLLNKPKLPKRSAQAKFACVIATLWLGAIIFSFYSGAMLTGYILGGILLVVAFLVSVLDFCIPSFIYNFFTKYEVK